MSKDHESLPLEVREAIRSFLDGHKPGHRIAMSQAIAAVVKAFPDLDLHDEDLADAIAGQAQAEQLEIEFDRKR